MRTEILEFKKYANNILKDPIYAQMKTYIQHGNTTCYKHCLHVAFYSFLFALWIEKKFNVTLDKEEIIKAGLLHDFFLYDWHTYKKFQMRELLHLTQMHGFTHPSRALENAEKYFPVSDIEADMITHHMWPLTIKLPKYKQSYIIIIIDKYCTIHEMIENKKK